MAYLYRHIRLDKNEPFYVGIGKDSTYERAHSNLSRNKHWHNISKKGYEVDILLEDLTWEQACGKEKEFIELYGRKDLNTGCLVNMTNGGDGLINPSLEVVNRIKNTLENTLQNRTEKEKIEISEKIKQSIRKTGKVRWEGQNHTEVSKQKMSLAKKGKKSLRKNYKCNLNTKKLIGNSLREYFSTLTKEELRLKYGSNSGVLRIHINNGKIRKFIKPEELSYYLSLGYKKGRL